MLWFKIKINKIEYMMGSWVFSKNVWIYYGFKFWIIDSWDFFVFFCGIWDSLEKNVLVYIVYIFWFGLFFMDI